MSFLRTIRSNEGTAAVEFAVILPLLLTMLFGVIEFGLLLYDKAVLTNACREGARYGIVSRIPRRTSDEIQTVIQNYCVANLITFGAQNTPVASVNFTTQNFGDDLTVTTTYNYNFLYMEPLAK
jgi:Flp pilus assembly protein TadG